MTAWTPEQLEYIGAADELEIAVDGVQRRWTPIWVVCVGEEVFVRTWYRRDTGWYGHALNARQAQVRVPGLEIAVTIENVAQARHADVDAAYRAKYRRYGHGSVEPMVADAAVATTLRLSPQSQESGDDE